MRRFTGMISLTTRVYPKAPVATPTCYVWAGLQQPAKERLPVTRFATVRKLHSKLYYELVIR
jgi:hypothetical protein